MELRLLIAAGLQIVASSDLCLTGEVVTSSYYPNREALLPGGVPNDTSFVCESETGFCGAYIIGKADSDANKTVLQYCPEHRDVLFYCRTGGCEALEVATHGYGLLCCCRGADDYCDPFKGADFHSDEFKTLYKTVRKFYKPIEKEPSRAHKANSSNLRLLVILLSCLAYLLCL